MKNELERLFDCRRNGVKVLLPLAEAHEELWLAPIGVVRPQLWLRHNILGSEMARFLGPSDRSGFQFGLWLMTRRRGSLLKLDDIAELTPDRLPPTSISMATMARRFAKLFSMNICRADRPFEYNGLPDFGRVIPAYRMKADWFLILGKAGGPDNGFDWQVFTNPPVKGQ